MLYQLYIRFLTPYINMDQCQYKVSIDAYIKDTLYNHVSVSMQNILVFFSIFTIFIKIKILIILLLVLKS